MNSSTEINIAAYSPVPELQVTDIAQKTTRNDITDQELDGTRGRPRADYLWRSLYECHRAGSKRSAMAIQRTLQKKNNPEEVVITVDGNHCHVLGSAEDLQHLPLSTDVKEAILQRLQEGYNTRNVRFAMHRAFHSHNEAAASIPHRDKFIHSEDVYNIRKVFERVYKRHDDQKTSVKHWLNHLETKNYNVFIDNDYDSSLTFGFCSAWQASLLAETKGFFFGCNT
ncbi:hypothetical protein BCV72DRAFT_334370 [Rhizopus microsporus var. microsporus]|uniref:Uncharacterized protein n=1 Tax=Rhizopus microsporus var. microsporus TaxID=86635 RepID=A0A1X0R943_RHIZD|nr:hypothetical protein BCV72DRAFT_334370 [Rhizopus microsporus var. microsporus]